MRLLAAALIGALLSNAAVAQFKWVDANGRVSYGDNPPPNARSVERINAPGGDPSSPLATLPYELRRAVENHPVVLYSTRECGPCEGGRQLLAARGVPFAERELGTRAEVEELKRRGLGGDLPVLTVGKESLRGFETGAWHRLLDTAGYPRASQLPSSWKNPAPRPLIEAPPPAAAPAAAPSN